MLRLVITTLLLHTTICCVAQETKNNNNLFGSSLFKAIHDKAREIIKNSALVKATPLPKEELSTGINDLTLNKINYVHHRFPSLMGDSISISVKERLFDTTDIDLKERVFKTGLENPLQTAHASVMATIIGGAGNSSPIAKGVAVGSRLTSTSFANLFPEADSFYQGHKISVQNHSYGTVIENFYGPEASAYDKTAINNPTLVLVFSAGNSGTVTTTTGPYANVQQYANLTGNFKQAKNIITVGATDSLNVIQAPSSKGPAHDGRVKPELVAFGEDGSSGAAALVSGAAALIQDVYRKNHSQLPASSLVKSILINSADDIGSPNVDYTSGFGSLNAFRAFQTISNNSYFNDAVSNNAIKTFAVSVPSSISRVKITLVWNDPAATSNSTKALINDLDIVVRNNASSQSWLPWVLNSFPHKDSLQLPAQRKRDTLNNIEQITIENPVPGNYTIEILGSRVTTSSQMFSVAYQFDTANTFYFTYPTASDPLLSGNTHTIRWETNRAGNGILEYATNGTNWRAIATVADVSKEYHKWQLPDTVTIAQLRLRAGAEIFLSDTFVISPQLNMDVGFNCADSFLLYWNRLPVGQYKLYELGARYLQPFQQTTDTSILLRASQHPSIFYAVAPLIGNKEGVRSNSLNYVSQSNGCYIRSFFLQSQTTQTATLRAEIGTILNVTEVALEKFDGNRFAAIQTITNPISTIFSLADTQLKQGENLYRFKVRLSNGTLLYSNTELAYHFTTGRPVVTYPNPVEQGNPINIISSESGRYTIQIIDASGRTVYTQLLTATLTKLSSNIFGKGVFIIRIQDKDAKALTQKLIVY